MVDEIKAYRTKKGQIYETKEEAEQKEAEDLRKIYAEKIYGVSDMSNLHSDIVCLNMLLQNFYNIKPILAEYEEAMFKLNSPEVGALKRTGILDARGLELRDGDVIKTQEGEILVIMWSADADTFLVCDEWEDPLSKIEYSYVRLSECVGNININPDILKEIRNARLK